MHLETISPTILSLISSSIKPSHEAGTITMSEGYYGQIFYRICGIVDLYKAKDVDKIHPMHWNCAYSTDAWGFVTEIGFLETHLIVGFCLESDNANWNPIGTQYEANMNGRKRKLTLPITLSNKSYTKWKSIAEPYCLDIFDLPVD